MSTFIPSEEQQAIFDALLNESGNILVRARAGTGKTTTLIEAMKLIPNCTGMYCAFNKSIVNEIQPRLSGTRVEAKTFHSMGYGSLLSEVSAGKFDVSGSRYKEHGDWWMQTDEGKRAFNVAIMQSEISVPDQEAFIKKQQRYTRNFIADLCNFMRLKLADWSDIETLHEIAFFYRLDEEIDPAIMGIVISDMPAIMRHAEAQVKIGNIDFTDMIYWIVKWDLSIRQHQWLFVDECQDLSEMQRAMVKKAVRPDGRVILVGDEHQCQPPGTLISMADGTKKPIEDVRCSDKLVSYDRRSGHWMRRANVNETARRIYSGWLYTVRANNKSTRATDSHKWLVKWDNINTDKWITYIMRRGDQYRVGIVQMFVKGSPHNRDNRMFGLSGRLNSEKADAGWVIGIHDNYVDAYTQEQVVSSKYGLPQLTFHVTNGSRLTQWEIDNIHNQLSTEANADDCLQAYGRNIHYPLIDRLNKQQRRGGSTYFVTESCNLIPGYMAVPVPPDEITFHPKTPFMNDFRTIEVATEWYEGLVYSLEVARYELYVADGILTHNSIYAFAGANSNSLDLSIQEFNAKVLPMTVTRRCGSIITEHAARLVPDFKALDGAHRGKIVWLPEAQSLSNLSAGDLVICRIKAPLVSQCLNLIAAGKPATILGTEIGRALVAILERLEEEKGFQFSELREAIKAWRDREVRKYILKDDEAGAENTKDMAEALLVLHESVEPVTMREFTDEILGLFSDKELRGSIVLCTSHKSKGLEADRVFILRPDKLPLLLLNAPGEIQRQETNLEYVTITRAKQTLVYLTNSDFVNENFKPAYVQDDFEDRDWPTQAELPAVLEITQEAEPEAEPESQEAVAVETTVEPVENAVAALEVGDTATVKASGVEVTVTSDLKPGMVSAVTEDGTHQVLFTSDLKTKGVETNKPKLIEEVADLLIEGMDAESIDGLIAILQERRKKLVA